MKTLKWRLSKLPTVQELEGLVVSKIITQEEARQILFTSETEEDRDKKSLESEIKFLREMVEKLSNRSQIVEVIKEIQPIYRNYPWYDPYRAWCQSGPTLYATSGSISLHALNTGANTVTGIGTSANGSGNSAASSQGFSDIKTF